MRSSTALDLCASLYIHSHYTAPGSNARSVARRRRRMLDPRFRPRRWRGGERVGRNRIAVLDVPHHAVAIAVPEVDAHADEEPDDQSQPGVDRQEQTEHEVHEDPRRCDDIDQRALEWPRRI